MMTDFMTKTYDEQFVTKLYDDQFETKLYDDQFVTKLYDDRFGTKIVVLRSINKTHVPVGSKHKWHLYGHRFRPRKQANSFGP